MLAITYLLHSYDINCEPQRGKIKLVICAVIYSFAYDCVILLAFFFCEKK